MQLGDEGALQRAGRERHPSAELELEHDERLEADQRIVDRGALM